MSKLVYTAAALLVALVLVLPAFSEKTTQVSLRFSRQDGNVRIVMESDGDFLKNTNVVASAASIRVAFPSAYELSAPRDFVYQIIRSDRWLTINLRDVVDVRTSELPSPARLIFDLKTAPSQGGASQAPGSVAHGLFGQVVPSGVSSPARGALKVVVIDPGHGGYDYGLVRKDINEKGEDLAVSRDLAAAFTKNGRLAFLTRRADQAVSITERILSSNSRHPDVFMSLHATPSDKFVVYTSPGDETTGDAVVKMYSLLSRQNRHIQSSRDLAAALADSLKKAFKAEVVMRELPLPVLGGMDATAVLIEYPLGRDFASDKKGRGEFVAAVLKGVADYER